MKTDFTWQANRSVSRLRLAAHTSRGLCASSALGAIFLSGQPAHVAAVFAAITALIAFGIGILISRRAIDELRLQKRLFSEAREAQSQVQELFAMTDMLQAAEDHEDAGAVLMATSLRLLPGYGGALYVFNNSRDRLDLAKAWNHTDGFDPSASLLPSNCWALKRGKPHINDSSSATLCCMHHIGSAATIEVPMMARGQVHGLLVMSRESEGAYNELNDISRVARALADSMSLALSNIALREKLRTQSLRDPLTGLYNRRYMEDALERYISLSERTGSATSVVMIDLDNFKRLNDDYGHAKGDAVLRDVAAQLVGTLRPSDVVARYGGEELVVILPNCGTEDALIKTEQMRLRIESLSEVHAVSISGSFGVATVPETSTSAADVIPMADAALYVAKNAGKNCVRTAEKRVVREDVMGPRLAVTGISVSG